MGVTVPSSGTLITAASVEQMHEDVRAIVNALTSDNCRPNCFNEEHLPSIIADSDYSEITTNTNVPIEPAHGVEAAYYMPTEWVRVAGWHVDNGGPGYTLPPCWVIMWATFHLDELSAVYADHRWQLWANLYHVFGPPASPTDLSTPLRSRMIFGQANVDGVDTEHQDDDVAIVSVLDYSTFGGMTDTWVLGRVGVQFAKYRGDTASVTPTFIISNGAVGFIAIRSGR